MIVFYLFQYLLCYIGTTAQISVEPRKYYLTM